MSDGPKIPDFIPDDVWSPRQFTLTHEEWRAVGLISHLVMARLISNPEPTSVGEFARTVAVSSKTYTALALTEEERAGVLLAVVFAYLENTRVAKITPSFLVARPPNAKFHPMDALVTRGPRLASEEGCALYKAVAFHVLAASVGEMTPGLARALLGSPPSV